MGAPRTNDRGLSFKEKLQLAIAETDEKKDGLSNTPEGSGRNAQGISSTLTSSTSTSLERRDELMSSLRQSLNGICLLEKVAELLLLEREKAEISSKDSEKLREALRAKDDEVADLRGRLELTEQNERKLLEGNANLKKQCESLTARVNVSPQRPPPPQQRHQQVQVPSPLILRPPELQPKPPVLQRKLIRIGSPPLQAIPKPIALPPASTITASPGSRIHPPHHNQSQHHLRSDSPPRLSPAITPRPSSRSHPSEEEGDLDLEAPPAASKLPQRRSMSPYNTPPHKIHSPLHHRDRTLGSPDRHGEMPPRTRVYPAANSRHRQHRNSDDHKSRERMSSGGGSDIFFNGVENYGKALSPRDVFDLVPVTKDFLMTTSSGDSDRMSSHLVVSPFNPDPPTPSADCNPLVFSSKKESPPRHHFNKHHFLKVKQKIGVPSPLELAVKAPTSTNTSSCSPASPKPSLPNSNPISLPEEVEVKAKKEVEVRQASKTTLVVNERLNCMTTRFPYYINETEDQMSEMLRQQQEEEETVGNNVEVPAWRIKLYEPLSDPEDYSDTEELTEAVFLKRHQRLEIDEKRRKRWDSQRVREETYLERLKRRMQERERQKIKRRKAAGRRPGFGGADRGESDDEMEFVHPSPEDILYIRVSDDIPISVFGHLMPITEKSTFDLPWSPPPPLVEKTSDSPLSPPMANNNDTSSSAHDASSSSSVSSLPSLPSPTVVPHLRKPISNQSPISGGGGYSFSSSASRALTFGGSLSSESTPTLISITPRILEAPPSVSNHLTNLTSDPSTNSNDSLPNSLGSNLGSPTRSLGQAGVASASADLKTLLKR